MAKRLEKGPLDEVRVGLVVPSFGYANFLPEMASSILAQRTDVRFLAVLVDDCDPDASIVSLCQTYATAYPDVFHYIRPRRNGGLSATRNAGIEYLLGMLPDLEMVMFPDADDRMRPGFIQKSYDAFRAAKRRADAEGETLGWVFEHPNIFGQDGFMHRLTVHSKLWNLVGATQMPSSALSADLYRSGLRYDESMKWGGEDWEFSIRALNAGFVGKHAQDLGFLWRRRPGSMSSAALQNKAREHNRTLIRMRNAHLFQRDEIWERWQKENTHFALLEADGWKPARSVAALREALAGAGECRNYRDLARQLNNSMIHPADPCPQGFYVAARDAHGAAAVPTAQLRQVILWSEYLSSKGFAVTHGMSDDTSETPVPSLEPYAASDVADFLHVLTRGQLIGHLRAPPVAPEKHLRLIWPRQERVPRATGLVADNAESLELDQGGIPEQLLSALSALGTSGYGFQRPARYKTQTWQPQNLSWRKLPGFLLGVPSQVLQDTEYLDRTIVLSHVRYGADLCARLESLGLSGVDVMIDLPGRDVFHEKNLRMIRDCAVINDVHVMQSGTSHGIDLQSLSINILGLYGSIIHWRSTEHALHLSTLRKIGAKNTLMLTRADAKARVLNVNSMFKCYDQYAYMDGDGHRSIPLPELSSHGIARYRQSVVQTPTPGNEKDITNQRIPTKNAI